MSDNKSRDIFYAVVAVATLIVALIGATLAYFSMTATSGEGAVSATAAVVSIDYEDGQNLIAQGENLIPVDFNIMQTLYRTNLDAINAQASTPIDENETTPRKNACQDGKNENYEVCSVFRYTVTVTGSSSTIIGSLRTEYNGFTDLYYAIRDVDCNDSTEDNCWLPLEGSTKYSKLSTCGDGASDACFTGDTTKTYTTEAIRPLFGYDSSYNFNTLTVNNESKSYDVVLFILNKADVAQDYDQGKTYRGNLFIETANGERIYGQLSTLGG